MRDLDRRPALNLSRRPEMPRLPGVMQPPVPVLPSTMLGFELLLGQRALDLRAARDLLCADPGALLHLFALVGEEFGDAPERPRRLDECIAGVSAEHLLRTLAGAGSARREQAGYARFALHGAAVGRHAQAVADSLGLPREQALLVGTLHELGTLPALLGWHLPLQDAVAHCGDLARRYRLPEDLCAALQAVHSGQTGRSGVQWSLLHTIYSASRKRATRYVPM